MKQCLKYYTSACGPNNGNFLLPLGYKHTSKLEEADVIIFGGGADVSPETYQEEAASSTYASKNKEEQEIKDFKEGRRLGKKFLGICRGAQLLTALAGGKLIQDVSGHSGSHKMTTYDGVTIDVNSIHHQMCNPYTMKDPTSYRILSWSTNRLSKRYIGARDKSVYLPWGFKEVESAYYPKINAIAYQFHPEMMVGSKNYRPAVDWVQNTFIKFMNNKL